MSIGLYHSIFATSARFRLRSGAVLKCCSSRIFRTHAKKYISRHCVEKCHNSMGRNRICDTGTFSLAFWGGSKMLLHERGFFARMRKKYFSALCWGMRQSYGWAPISWHRRVFVYLLGQFWKAASRARFFDRMRKNISQHCGGECPNSIVGHRFCDTGASSLAFLGQFRKAASRAWFFRSHAKKTFLGNVVGNSPNLMDGHWFCDTDAFLLAF